MKNTEKEILERTKTYLEETLELCEKFTSHYGEGVRDGYRCALDHLNFLLRLYNYNLEEIK